MKEKKRHLSELREAYQISVRTSTSDNEEDYSDQVAALKEKLKKTKIDNEQEIQKLQTELQTIQEDNKQL